MSQVRSVVVIAYRNMYDMVERRNEVKRVEVWSVEELDKTVGELAEMFLNYDSGDGKKSFVLKGSASYYLKGY